MPGKKFGLVHMEDAELWRDGPEIVISAFRNAADKEEEWIVYEPSRDGGVPKLSDGLTGVIITGSHYNLSDPATPAIPWIASVIQFVRDVAAAAADGSVPAESLPCVLGICFGSQLIGYALGGEVTRNPTGQFFLKAEEVVPTAAFAEQSYARGYVLAHGRVHDLHDDTHDAAHAADPAAARCAACARGEASPLPSCETSPCLRLMVSHGDCVATLPPGGVLLGTSASCTNEIYAVGKHFVGIQSHPEFEYDLCIKQRIWPAVVGRRQRLNEEEQAEAMESFAKPRHSLTMRLMLQRFLHKQHL